MAFRQECIFKAPNSLVKNKVSWEPIWKRGFSDYLIDFVCIATRLAEINSALPSVRGGRLSSSAPTSHPHPVGASSAVGRSRTEGVIQGGNGR